MAAPQTSTELTSAGFVGSKVDLTNPFEGQLTHGMPWDRAASEAFSSRYREAVRTFGPPKKLTPDDPNGEVPREIDFLPTLWADKPLPHVNEQIVMMQNVEMQQLLYRVAPLRIFKGNPVHKEKKVIFHQGRPDTYTHTGVPRMVYHSFKEWDTAIDRRGLGLEMEAEFFGTAQGTKIFQLSLQQIQIAILESAAIDVVNALLRARPVPRNFYEARQLPMPYAALKRALQPELTEWAILMKNKNGYGLYDLARSVKNRIKAAGGKEPNCVILPGWTRDYVRTHSPKLTSFMERGERGPTAFDNNTVLSTMVDNLAVIESPAFRTEDDLAPPEEPLEYPRCIGEHWYNSGRGIDRRDFKDFASYKQARLLTVHNNDTDSWQEITLDDVAGAVSTASANYDNIAEIKTICEDFIGATQAEPRTEQELIAAIARLNQYAYVAIRPYMTYKMVNAIFLRDGGQVIHTAVGYGDFRLGFDAARKKVLGHYTTYLGPVITDPESIYVAYNIAATEYLGGGGCTPNEDIYYVIVKLDDHAVAANLPVLPINGSFPKSMFNDEALIQAKSHYALAEEWARVYDFGEAPNNLLDVGYAPQMFVNTRTFLGTSFTPTLDANGKVDKRRGNVTMGQGHWGSGVYPGVGEDRLGRGANGFINPPEIMGQ